jgi:manganese transport protein
MPILHGVDFVELAGYGGAATGGHSAIRLLKDLDAQIAGRDVLLVEDVVDTGLTMNYLAKTLRLREPRSLAAVTLFDRPYRRLVDELPVAYVGFTIPDEFFVGYGFDLDERFRGLPDLHLVIARENGAMMATRAGALPRPLGSGEDVLRGNKRFRIWPFLGPAFIACVAYIDPGNFATNIAGGSKFGYTLVWVIVASNLMAMLIQSLSAKLGIATGRNLPEVCRERFSRRTSLSLWVQAEAIAMATDLAEFLGAALGFHLLLDIPLFPAALLTGVAAFAILGLQRFGFRPIEAVIASIVAVIGACYVAELFYVGPSYGSVAKHAVVPEFAGNESVLLAVGILGATVMPHVIYLHSALMQGRIVPNSDDEARRLYKYTRIDVAIAMTIAGLINVSMLVMAAAAFFKSGLVNVDSIEGAHRTLQTLLGGGAKSFFALALLGSGLSSSTVGTMSGQIVMQGFIKRQIPLWVRRAVTMIPALVVVGIGVDPSRTLVLSQVVLSFGIPFALIPLVIFTSRKDIMGVLVNHKATTAVAIVVVALICALNVYLLAQTFGLG